MNHEDKSEFKIPVIGIGKSAVSDINLLSKNKKYSCLFNFTSQQYLLSKNESCRTNMLVILSQIETKKCIEEILCFVETAKSNGVYTIVIITKPLIPMNDELYETIEKIRENSSLIIVSDGMVSHSDDMNDMLSETFSGIFDSFINQEKLCLDVKGIKNVFQNKGDTIIGIGTGHGTNRINVATIQAINNLKAQNIRMDDANNVLISIMADSCITQTEVQFIKERMKQIFNEKSNIKLINMVDENLNEKIKITVIANDFGYNLFTRQEVCPTCKCTYPDYYNRCKHCKEELITLQEMGNRYFRGYLGVGINWKSDKAFKWYKRDAEQGNLESCVRLSNFYMFGIGTRKSKKTALMWRRLAVKSILDNTDMIWDVYPSKYGEYDCDGNRVY